MTDTFRKHLEPLHEKRAELILAIKNKADELYMLFDYENTREMSIAKMNLEQGVMWAVKSITSKPTETILEPSELDHS